MPDQDSEDEVTTPKTNNEMDSDTKSTVNKSSLENRLPTHCLHCGILGNKADSEWSVLDVCIYIYIYTVTPQTVIYSFGHFVQYVSPAGDCEWLWTKPDSDQIQHRARNFFYGFQRQTQSFSKASHMSQIKLRRPQLQKI